MSLKNYNVLAFVPPIGEDLQHVDTDNGVSIHTDITLLSRLSDLKLSQSLQDAILSRFQSVKDDLPDDVASELDKVSDFDKIKFTDSRYQQTLSDRKDKISDLIRKFDDKVSELKDSDSKSRLLKARQKMDEYTLALFGND